MLFLTLKALISGILIALASTLAKRYPGFGALIASLPMFLVIPALLRAGIGFWPALGLGCALTIALYFAMLALAPRFGIAL